MLNKTVTLALLLLVSGVSSAANQHLGQDSKYRFRFQKYDPTTSSPDGPERFKTDLEVSVRLQYVANNHKASSTLSSENKAAGLDAQESSAFHTLASTLPADLKKAGWALVEQCSTDFDKNPVNSLWVVYRGSTNFNDWMKNLDAFSAPIGFTENLACMGVHAGFLSVLGTATSQMREETGVGKNEESEDVREVLKTWFKEKSRCKGKGDAAFEAYDRFKIAGHSLGGAVGTLATSFLFLDQDVLESDSKDKLQLDLSSWNSETAKPFEFLNGLARAALNLSKLDASSYSRIQAIVAESVPPFARLSGELRDQCKVNSPHRADPRDDIQALLSSGDNIVRRRLQKTFSVSTAAGIDSVPRITQIEHNMKGGQFLGWLQTRKGYGEMYLAPFQKILLFANNTEAAANFLDWWWRDDAIADRANKHRVLEIPTDLLAETDLLGMRFLIPPRANGKNAWFWRLWGDQSRRAMGSFIKNQVQHEQPEHRWILVDIDSWKGFKGWSGSD